ncbi:MAG: nucleotidyltransferase domain-containing protein [Gammaproteobacteria bacterium]|nr:nucleotidyltransferase domain-containing protein [Gammaproteobacteria bacterium]
MTNNSTTQATKLFMEKVAALFPVKRVVMFGSRARGDYHAESDIDLAILLAEPSGDFFALKLAMDDLAYDILLETGARIQALPIWQDEWQNPEQYSNPYLIKNIQREGVAL